ncbi:MAG: hypothetical protein HZA81_01175 [Candidatus Taylorbacteria bacterium]|nr:hypothetical protein [Candidatus Taylorbacteria bacterium]
MTGQIKRVLFLAALVSFAAIAVFGGWDIVVSQGLDMPGCLATSLNGFDCPSVPGTLGFLNFHIKPLADFSSGAFSAAISALSALALLAVAVCFASAPSRLAAIEEGAPAAAALTTESGFTPLQKSVSVRWLALFVNSPADIQGA